MSGPVPAVSVATRSAGLGAVRSSALRRSQAHDSVGGQGGWLLLEPGSVGSASHRRAPAGNGLPSHVALRCVRFPAPTAAAAPLRRKSAPAPAATQRQEQGQGEGQGGLVTEAWNAFKSLGELLAPVKEAVAGGGQVNRQQSKEELLARIQPLQRGLNATLEDAEDVEQLASRLESANPTPSTVTSPLINGKWKLIYTTSASIIGKNRLFFLRPWGPIFQAIDNQSLQARNIETWPFFNQVQATLTPVSKTRVDVKFDEFKILGLIPVKAPEPRGPQAFLETTYLDDDLRISRGNLGNLFVLVMDDASYQVPKPEK